MQAAVTEYNQMIDIYTQRGISFHRNNNCPKVNLTIYKQQHFLCNSGNTSIIQHSHKMVNLYSLARTSYMACITLPNGHHIHNILPIMIGSKLDIDMHKDVEYCENPLLAGLYLMEGVCVIFPYLYTNHRESIHQDMKTGEMIIYIYDNEKKGYKIFLKDGEIIIREPDKTENRINDFDVSTIDHNLIHHLDLYEQKTIFEIFKRQTPTIQAIKDNIDSFKNKILLHPLSLIDRAIQMAIKFDNGNKKNPARDILIEGNIERLLSKNIQFNEKRTMCGNYNKSYGLRKVQPSRVGRCGHDDTVEILRPVPKNVRTTSTVDSYGFICSAEKSTSLGDSHAKSLCLVPGCKTINFCTIQKNALEIAITKLLKLEAIVPDYSVGVPLLINGGLRTKYNVVWGVKSILNFIKFEIDQLIEVVYEEEYCMLSFLEGLTFTKLKSEMYVTTRELDLYFPTEVKNIRLFGPNVYNHVIEDGGYLNVARLMSGVNYSKNRFGGERNLNYFTTTNENSNVYITDKDFNQETETLKADLVFSSHTQLCGDGLVVDCERPITGTIITRSRFEFDLQPGLVYQPIYSKEPMIEYDSLGNIITKIFLLGKFQKIGTPLDINIFKQNKIFYTEMCHHEAYTYLLYKIIDDEETLAAKNILFDVYETKSKFYIDFYTMNKDTSYDGLKLSDQCAQKGLTNLQDVSQYEKYLGYRPRVVASLSSIIGRTPLHQCKMLVRNKKESKTNNILVGEYNFDILKNAAFTMTANSKIRFDSQMKSVLGVNGMNNTLEYLENVSLFENDRNTFLPNESEIPLSIINVLKVAVEYTDENNVEYTSLNV